MYPKFLCEILSFLERIMYKNSIYLCNLSHQTLFCLMPVLDVAGSLILEGDDEDELEVELAGVVVSEYFSSNFEIFSERLVLSSSCFTFASDGLFSTTTTVSWLLRLSLFDKCETLPLW